jgi:hypothetical protein
MRAYIFRFLWTTNKGTEETGFGKRTIRIMLPTIFANEVPNEDLEKVNKILIISYKRNGGQRKTEGSEAFKFSE